MSRILIVDDVYTDKEIQQIEFDYQRYFPWYYTHGSNLDDEDDSVVFFVNDKRSKWTKNLEPTLFKDFYRTTQLLSDFEMNSKVKVKSVSRSYLNGHTYGLNGSWHVDDDLNIGDKNLYYTILYMMNSGDTSGIGGFEYIDPDIPKVQKVDFKSGRFIMFPSEWEHRGLSTTVKNKMRVTLAYKKCEVEFL